MKKLSYFVRIAVLFAVSVSLTSGCAIVYQVKSRSTNEKFMQLNPGMSRTEVLSILGTPYRREVYEDKEFLIYLTNYRAYYEKDRFTPVLLESGKVVGWGSNYYDNTTKSKIDADIKIQTQ